MNDLVTATGIQNNFIYMETFRLQLATWNSYIFNTNNLSSSGSADNILIQCWEIIALKTFTRQ